jgi:signal transduction histidine kinase
MSESPGLPVTASVLAGIGALTAATIWGQASGDTATTLLTLDVTVGLASCALLPVLLRWPVPGAVALAVLAALSPAATPASTYATLHVALRRRFPVALVAAGAGVTGLLIRGLWRPIESLSALWWVVLVLVAEAALVGWGELSRARDQQARQARAEQARQVAEARAAERASIAREMHDVLAHRLSLLATYAGALEYRPDAPPEQLARAAGVVRASAHQALEELREVISVLREDVPDDVGRADGGRNHGGRVRDSGPGARPQPGLADLDALVAETRDAGTPVDLVEQIFRPQDAPGALARTAYRIVQEGLTNARKHAPGQPVRLLLKGRPGDRLLVELANPVGPAVSAAVDADARAGPSLTSTGAGTGLIGLTERVRLADGELDHGVGANGEFRLSASIPWPADLADAVQAASPTAAADRADGTSSAAAPSWSAAPSSSAAPSFAAASWSAAPSSSATPPPSAAPASPAEPNVRR